MMTETSRIVDEWRDYIPDGPGSMRGHVRNILGRNAITSRRARTMTDTELLALPGLGRGGLRLIREALRAADLRGVRQGWRIMVEWQGPDGQRISRSVFVTAAGLMSTFGSEGHYVRLHAERAIEDVMRARLLAEAETLKDRGE